MNLFLPPLTNAVIVLLICNTSFANNSFNTLNNNPVEKLSAKEIKARMLEKAGVFDLHYTADVKQNIENYTIRGRTGTQRIIGRAQIYFPIIEKYLAAYQLPNELKYLTVIESSLNPNATSSAGAVGLCQLMPATARRYGLVINGQVDERRDPHKSTQAALKYLTFLHKLLGDWTLAAAAYNCGGGGVQKAIRSGNGKNFWTIKEHLPEQTQHYINRLASALYVMNYYHLHGLSAAESEYFMKFTKMTTVYEQLSFQQISKALDIPITTLKKLNPSYRQQMLPSTNSGNYLILPKMKMDQFVEYYNKIIAGNPEDYIRT